MAEFQRINENIFYLLPSDGDGAITFVTGKNNFLIDSGSSDKVITEELAPALRKIGYNFRNIDYVVFTHCHPETIGGAHKLREYTSNAYFLAHPKQIDKLRNPTFYAVKIYEPCADYAPPFREVRGVFVDGLISDDNIIFNDIRPIFTPGHDDDCICWYHIPTKTLISGDTVQGNGTEKTGIAFYLSLFDYRETLASLESLGISNILCSSKMKGLDSVILTPEKCRQALRYSYDITDKYDDFVRKYEYSNSKYDEKLTLPSLVSSYFEKAERPECFGYAILTLRQHCLKIAQHL